MTWKNNRLSYSHLAWWRTCHRAFELSMSGTPGKMVKVVENAAAFGNRSEKLWDTVFKSNWFALSDAEFDTVFLDALSAMPSEDAVKLKKGFVKCFHKLKELVGTEYHLEPQKKLSFTTHPYESYAKLDYFVISDDKHLILDAKGSSARNKKYIEQLLHYAYMYWKLHDIIPATYLFYTRLGHLDEHLFSESQLVRYGAFFERELQAIQAKRAKATELSSLELPVLTAYKATPGDYCFVCAHTRDCTARNIYIANKQQEQEERSMLRDDELFI